MKPVALSFVLALTPVAAGGDQDYYLSVPLLGSVVKVDAVTGQSSIFASGLALPFYGYFAANGDLILPDLGFNVLLQVPPSGLPNLLSAGGLIGSAVAAIAHPAGGHVLSDIYFDRVVHVHADGSQSLIADQTTANGLLGGPGGMAWDSAGTLYVANNFGDTIVKIDPQGSVSVFSASPLIRAPGGIAIDGSGNLFAAMYDTHDIVRFRLDTGEATVMAKDSGIMKKPNDLKLSRSGGLLTTTRLSNLVRVDALGNLAVLFQDPTFGEIDGIAVPEDATPCSGTALSYGSGRAGTGGFVPELHAIFSPCPGALLGLEFRDYLGGTTGHLWFGTKQGATPLSGGTLLLDLAFPFGQLPIALPGTGAGAGDSIIQFQLPPDPFWSGITLYLQTTSHDPEAPGGTSFSNGLALTIGH